MRSRDADVIVTGAGMAGMMAACFLARGGRRVLVLEANHQPGGLMAGIWRQGYYFDVGDQSFENMGIVFPLLRQLGLYDARLWERARYQIRMPDIDVVVESLEQTEAAFCRAFPGQRAGLRRVFAAHRETSELVTRLTSGGAVPYVESSGTLELAKLLVRLAPRLHRLPYLLLKDAGRWYREQMPPGPPRELFARCGYSNMSLFIASAFWHLWANDYWYPHGGLSALFRRLEERLTALGGEVRYQERVERYLIEDGAVRGVRTRKGEHLSAPIVVHTGDLHHAVFDLIGADHFDPRFVARLRGAAVADAMVSVYLGVRVPPDELRKTIRASHLFYFPSYDCGLRPRAADPDYHRSQFVEVTAHSLSQPGLAPAGASSLVAQCFSDLGFGESWGRGPDGRGPRADYRAVKRRVGRQILGRLEEILPGLGQRIEWLDVGSPVTTVRFTGNRRGATCGFALNLRSFPFLPRLGSFTTPVRDLYWAGHYTLWPGSVPTAALSGKIVADRILSTPSPRR